MSSPRFCVKKTSRSNLRKSASTSDDNPPSPARSFASQTRSKVRDFAHFPGAAHRTDSDSDSVVSGRTASTGLQRLRKDSSCSSLSFTNLIRRVKTEKNITDDDQIQASIPNLDITPLSQTFSHECRLRSLPTREALLQQATNCQLRSDRKEEVTVCQLVEDPAGLEASKSEGMDPTLDEQDPELGFEFLSFRFPAQANMRQRARTMAEPISEREELEPLEPRVQSHVLDSANSRTPELSLDITAVGNHGSPNDDRNSTQSSDPNPFEDEDEDDGDRSSFCTVSSETPELERDAFCFPKWPSEEP